MNRDPRCISRLLIDDKPLQVLPALAVAVGLHEAIVLQQLHWRLNYSEHVYDGKPWVFDSCEKWQQRHFPFWCVRTIKRIFAKLREDKLIIVRKDLNAHGYDTTCWYTIDYEQLAARDGLQGRIRQRSDTLSLQPGQFDTDETQESTQESTPDFEGKDNAHAREDLPACPPPAPALSAVAPAQEATESVDGDPPAPGERDVSAAPTCTGDAGTASTLNVPAHGAPASPPDAAAPRPRGCEHLPPLPNPLEADWERTFPDPHLQQSWYTLAEQYLEAQHRPEWLRRIPIVQDTALRLHAWYKAYRQRQGIMVNGHALSPPGADVRFPWEDVPSG